jgi:hypothetical protein
VQGDPVTGQERDGGGVDVDGRQGDKVTDVGHRDVHGRAVGPLDDQALTVAPDAARGGQPVGSLRIGCHGYPQQ